MLTRWTLDPKTRTAREVTLSQQPQEFPRVDERLTGRKHRFIYGSGTWPDRGPSLCFDTDAGVELVHDHGPGRFGSECVFVPKSEDAPEGEGWVMTYVWDATTNTSDIVIIDSAKFAGPAQAIIRLPVRVPFGFHGSWLAD